MGAGPRHLARRLSPPWRTNSARPIALATAWAAGEVNAWTELAQEAIASDPVKVLRQMNFIVTQLAETIAEQSGGAWTTGTVLQHLALEAEEDSGDDGQETL